MKVEKRERLKFFSADQDLMLVKLKISILQITFKLSNYTNKNGNYRGNFEFEFTGKYTFL